MNRQNETAARRARLPLVAILALALLPGCLFTKVRTPLDTNLDNTNLGSKIGYSSAQSVLGLVAWGDAGIQAAARDGDIQVIAHADQEFLAILGFVYVKDTVIVYGD